MISRRVRWLALAGLSLLCMPVLAAQDERIVPRIEAELAALDAAPSASRAGREIRLSRILAENSPEGIRVFAASESTARKGLLLRLMGVSGNRDYLVLVHRELAVIGKPLHRPALMAAIALNDPSSAPYLKSFLRSRDVTEVVLALRYFRAHPDGLGREDIVPLLGSRHPAVRESLLGLLPHFPAGITWKYCRRAMKEASLPLRIQGARCLGRMKHGGGKTALLESFAGSPEALQVEIIRALRRMDPEGSLPHFMDWLVHDRPRVALASLIALQELNAGESVPLLMEMVAAGRGSIPRNLLIKSLGLFRDRRALPFLGERLRRSPDAKEKISLIAALGDLGLIEGQRYLAEYLSDYDPDLREAARKAVREIARLQIRSESQ